MGRNTVLKEQNNIGVDPSLIFQQVRSIWQLLCMMRIVLTLFDAPGDDISPLSMYHLQNILLIYLLLLFLNSLLGCVAL